MTSQQIQTRTRYFQNHKLDDVDAHAKIEHAIHQLDWAQKSLVLPWLILDYEDPEWTVQKLFAWQACASQQLSML